MMRLFVVSYKINKKKLTLAKENKNKGKKHLTLTSNDLPLMFNIITCRAV